MTEERGNKAVGQVYFLYTLSGQLQTAGAVRENLGFPYRTLRGCVRLVGQLVQASLGLCGLSGRFYLVDGLPIRVCKTVRHGRVRLLREDGAYFGKSTVGWFFGFKLHALAHHSGLIVSAILSHNFTAGET